MAPLNTDKVNEDDRSEDAIDSLNNIGELSGAYGLLAKTDIICRKRNSASHLKLLGMSSVSKGCSQMTDNCNIYRNNCKESDSSEDETCAKCLEQKNSGMTVYHKQKEHAITNSVNVKAALINMSPQWFKTFLNEPEFVMTETKTAHSSE